MIKWDGNLAVTNRSLQGKMIDDPDPRSLATASFDWKEFVYLWMAMFFLATAFRLLWGI